MSAPFCPRIDQAIEEIAKDWPSPSSGNTQMGVGMKKYGLAVELAAFSAQHLAHTGLWPSVEDLVIAGREAYRLNRNSWPYPRRKVLMTEEVFLGLLPSVLTAAERRYAQEFEA